MKLHTKLLSTLAIVVAMGLAEIAVASGSGAGATPLCHRSGSSACAIGRPPMPHSSVQLGIDVYWKHNPATSPSWQQHEATDIVHYVRSTLHANSVALSFPIFTSTETSSNVFVGPGTPTPSEIEMFVKTAQRAGLNVELRPLLEVGTRAYLWRGFILPTHLAVFFRAYSKVLGPYLKLAEQIGVHTFIYASEFPTISQKPKWRPFWTQLLVNLRKVYNGQLVYTESGSQFLSRKDVVPYHLDYGEHTDAYFSVPKATPSTSLATLYKSWATHFGSQAKIAANAILQEVGFDSGPTGYQHPQTVTGPPSRPKYLYMQQTWFTMVCDIVHHFHMKGVYFWKMDFDMDPLGPAGNIRSFGSWFLGPTQWVGRNGAAAIASCFSSF